MKIGMFKETKLIQAMLALAFLIAANFAGSQTFDQARELAFSGQREKAREVCRKILAEGFNSDVALLMGRTFAWDGMYDSARVVLSNVLVEKPGNMEAYDALSDVEFWSDNPEKAIEYCDEAYRIDSTAYNFVLKKARILYSGEEYEEAVEVLENYLKLHPGQPEFIMKLKDYRLETLKNNVRLTYTVDFFNKDFNRDPWQLMALSYGRKTGLGTIITRVNYASRFGSQGFQYELDAYPGIGKNNYGYLNYGFSKHFLFPGNRFGAEWYHNFPKAFEGSLGLRLLDFGAPLVDIYTATIGKYAGNYWISFRTFVTPDPGDISVSGFLMMRRYFSDSENYIGMRAGYGISPDDRRNPLDSQESLFVRTASLRAEFNHIFNKVWLLNIMGVYGVEELRQSSYSGYFTWDIGIAWLF